MNSLASPTATATAPRPFEELLQTLSANGELVHLERLAARAPRTRLLSQALHPELIHSLPFLDGGLWTHQASAIDHVLRGESVVVATGTASGKSLCYQVPLATAALKSGGKATSLLLFPTKALAQDQLRSLGALGIPGLVPVTYDGDTPADSRQWARKHASCVLTNPEMLHMGILPFHGRWANFLKRLQYVVIDELHIYRGVFGTHLAQILRRLRRMCTYYGGNPTFVFASATIGEPQRLAKELCGLDVALIDNDGSPHGERLIGVWNPPVSADGIPVSGNTATSTLLAALVADGHRTIAFTRSRRGAEIVAARAQRLVPDELASTIKPYRGGYLPAERRALEASLFDGSLRGVAATTALELGVDIGGLDACVCNGFPGTISSFRQQIGRAGRSAQRSLSLLVAGDDALDQWYAANPSELFSRKPESVVVNVANPFVLYPHIACAAHELPLIAADAEVWAGLPQASPVVDPELRREPGIGTSDLINQVDNAQHTDPSPRSNGIATNEDNNVAISSAQEKTARTEHVCAQTIVEPSVLEMLDRLGTADIAEAFDDGIVQLVQRNQLTLVNGRAVWAGRGSPSQRVSLRSGGGSEFRIVDRGARLVGTVDGSRAFSTLHTGALYVHQGQQYRVERLDLNDHAAWVHPETVDEYTQARSTTDFRFVGVHTSMQIGRLRLSLGSLEVDEQVVGYERKKITTGMVLSREPLELPASTLTTRGFWYEFGDDVFADAGLGDAHAPAIPGTLHAIEHTMIGMLPLFTICDRWDVGGVSTAAHQQTGKATILIYDGYPGGAGIAELGYTAGQRHLLATLHALEHCRCTSGCPSCVQSPKCGNGNEPLDKAGAIALLQVIAQDLVR
jgi:DEAD/DEAH box helicase domain-containing protein